MSDDAPHELLSRRHQMFPVLTDAEITRMRRFGKLRTHSAGTRLISAGEPSPGIFMMLSGIVAVSQRDGLGRITPIVQLGRGHFIGEVGSLSGQALAGRRNRHRERRGFVAAGRTAARAHHRRGRSR